MKREFILNLNELDELAKILPKEGVVILRGDLASGKTTLVKAIAKACGIDSDVTSPTFSVMQGYENNVFHYDIFQNGFEGILKNGLFENFFEEGLHLVEWGDDELEDMLKKFNIAYVKILITPHERGRKYEVFGA